MKTIPLTELLAKATRDEIRVSPSCYYRDTDEGIEAAFILANHSMRHIGPLVEALEEVIAYRRGLGKYNFSSVPFEDRGIAKLVAWEAIEVKLDALLAAAKSVEVQS